MKTELKAKFISFLAKNKKGNEGFTLIELLVVIIIIGILSAIALPSFLNQANKAKQSEAKQYVGSLVRSQQAYFLENSEFAETIPDLGGVVKANTANYAYNVDADGTGVSQTALATGTPNANRAALKAYGGKVILQNIVSTSEVSTGAALCEKTVPGATVWAAGEILPASAQGSRCTGGIELGLK
jgi:type IV pilus assembly protein PilA